MEPPPWVDPTQWMANWELLEKGKGHKGEGKGYWKGGGHEKGYEDGKGQWMDAQCVAPAYWDRDGHEKGKAHGKGNAFGKGKGRGRGDDLSGSDTRKSPRRTSNARKSVHA